MRFNQVPRWATMEIGIWREKMGRNVDQDPFHFRIRCGHKLETIISHKSTPLMDHKYPNPTHDHLK